MIDYVPPPGAIDPLKELTRSALEALKAAVLRVEYPPELCIPGARACWVNHHPRIAVANPGLLDSVHQRSGVYAILSAAPTGNWTLKYIGQTKGEWSRQRIRSHLIWRNKQTNSGRFTGSKFDEVAQAVEAGEHVGFSFVAIEPSSLRHYVEAELIQRCRPEWNVHGTSLKQLAAAVVECQWSRVLDCR